jgi:hypothetical protein
MTKDRTCRCCSQPVRNQDEICTGTEKRPGCVIETRTRLANQASHLGDLEVELARMSRKTAENDGGKVGVPASWAQAGPMKLSEITSAHLREWDRRARQAAALIAEQRNLLASWVRLAVDERLIADWPSDTVPVMACALIVALPHFRKHEAAGEFVAEIRMLTDHIVKCIDSPPYRGRFPAGPCFKEYPDTYGETAVCTGEVTAYVPADGSPAYLACGACKAQWDSTQWNRAGREMDKRKEQLRHQQELVASLSRRMSA